MRVERRSWDGGDARSLAAALRAGAPGAEDAVAETVAKTIAAVRERGDEALLELGERFDGVRVGSLRIDPGIVDAAPRAIEPQLRTALERAIANVRVVAEAQVSDVAIQPVLPEGQAVTISEVPVAAAGIYAPGGRAAYPSSVYMGVVPARAAGVERIVVVSPPDPGGAPPPVVLAAAALAGADEVYACGGAQAIAALAYGTESIAAVEMIAGPGSPWVQEAKLQVSRRVGIDGYAGPSELMVICDRSADPALLALDLCAQAEHGEDGLLVAAGTDPESLQRIGEAAMQLARARPSVADVRLDLIAVPGLEDALALAEALAPEHLELDCGGASDLAGRIRTAGCVFFGRHGATAFGDYAAGSNHVLPTGGAGRFTGPLGPGSFRRPITRVGLDSASAAALAPSVDPIARAEGFPVHGESARARAGSPTDQAS